MYRIIKNFSALCILMVSFIFLGFIFIPKTFAAEETITLTTYYPAPYGVYKQMSADQLIVGLGEAVTDEYANMDFGEVHIGKSLIVGKHDDGFSYRATSGTPPQVGDVLIEGNVGIGTNSPGAMLEVAQNNAIKLGSAYMSSGGNYAHFANNRWYDGSAWQDNGTPGALIQLTGQDTNFYRHDGAGTSTFSMRIKGDTGNVGIGADSPSYTLHVKKNVGGWMSRFENTNTGGSNVYLAHGGGYGTYIDAGTDASDSTYALNVNKGGTSYLYVRGDGYVGIGTTEPQNILDVSGESRFGNVKAVGGHFYSGRRTNFVLSLQQDRNMVLYDNGVNIWSSQTETSDIRLKKNITDLEPVLDKIGDLRVIRFYFTEKVDDRDQHIGLIAQEVEKHFPEFVYTDPVAGYKLIHYGKLTTILLQAIQEQQAQIEAQKAEYDALKERIEALEEIIKARIL